jgi:dipeptidyl aminopeptidase/acylaminoacyl peptidase
VSTRIKKTSQVFLLPSGSVGEAFAITDLKGSIGSLTWAPDGQRVLFLHSDEPGDEEKTDVVDFEGSPRLGRVWSVDIITHEAKPLSPEGLHVWEYSLSPKGVMALLVSNTPYEWDWYQARLVFMSPDGSLSTAWAPKRQIGIVGWSPDAEKLAVVAGVWSDRGSVAGDLYIVPLDGQDPVDLTRGEQRSITWAVWDGSGALWVTAWERALAEFGRIELGSATQIYWRGQASIAPLWWARFEVVAHSGAKNIVCVREDIHAPAEVFAAAIGDGSLQWRQLTDLHPEYKGIAAGEAELVDWKSADGTEIEGILIRPVGYKPGQRYPLVVSVHGGPTSQSAFRPYYYWEQGLAAKGCAILLPNYRGSTGRGTDFAEANLGDMGGGDLQDILSGVDSLIRCGLADPDRLGITGWSYGGFMTAWAITQTTRFKAAIVGAGITDWFSFHGVSEIPTWDEWYLEAHPYEDRDDVYRKWSPMRHISNVTTPTLILHGEKDTCVPVGQAYQLFRGLREQGITAALRVYPREPHGLREYAHLLDRYNQAIDWFTRYLGL